MADLFVLMVLEGGGGHKIYHCKLRLKLYLPKIKIGPVISFIQEVLSGIVFFVVKNCLPAAERLILKQNLRILGTHQHAPHSLFIAIQVIMWH